MKNIHPYGLVGLGISCILLLSTSTPVLTQIANHSPAKSQKIPPAAEFIWPARGIVSQGFRKYKHEGIDIAGPSGTPIVAAASGIVMKAGWDEWGLGNAIVIKHADGYITVYGHNRRLLVTKGKQVKQGQIIAEMGSTGNSTAPHLHFEIHPGGGFAVNPLSLLPSPIAGKTSPQVAFSPSSSTPAPIFAANKVTECQGNTVIQGETAHAFVKVCQEEDGQFFYIRQLKQKPTQPVKLKAINCGTKFRAYNGSFSYFVTSEGVEIWRHGILLRSDRFYTSKPAHS